VSVVNATNPLFVTVPDTHDCTIAVTSTFQYVPNGALLIVRLPWFVAEFAGWLFHVDDVENGPVRARTKTVRDPAQVGLFRVRSVTAADCTVAPVGIPVSEARSNARAALNSDMYAG
jgi:hypothetical protein